jgi:hypothetical protein
LGFAAIDATRFSYPLVAPGMVFRNSVGDEHLLQVTSSFTADQLGSPLFDDRGRLIGVVVGNQPAAAAAGYAVADLGAGNYGLRIEGLRTNESAAVAPSTPLKSAPAPKPSIEDLYERLAPAVVQIFVARH